LFLLLPAVVMVATTKTTAAMVAVGTDNNQLKVEAEKQ
jgi:hypothetical protein